VCDYPASSSASIDLFLAKYWPEPHAFKPERFLGDCNKDCFIPFFSAGARACLGRRYVRFGRISLGWCQERLCRFSEIEALTALALIVLHYRIEVLEEPQFAHETFEQREERILRARFRALTLTPKRVPLQLIRRK